MKHISLAALALASAMSISACSSVPLPQETLSQLDRNDASYDSEACLQGRNIAMTYEDKHITRTLVGTTLGLDAGTGFALAADTVGAASWSYGLGGVLDLVLVGSMENNQKKKQEAVNAEIYRRCHSGVRKSALIQDARFLPPGQSNAPVTIDGVVYTPYKQ